MVRTLASRLAETSQRTALMLLTQVLDELLGLYQRGSLRPHVQATYPLTNVSGAFADAATGRTVCACGMSFVPDDRRGLPCETHPSIMRW